MLKVLQEKQLSYLDRETTHHMKKIHAIVVFCYEFCSIFLCHMT